jgi:diguanylate cyclase (GGDEF)-like protein/PAS domain S-box-containing protein
MDDIPHLADGDRPADVPQRDARGLGTPLAGLGPVPSPRISPLAYALIVFFLMLIAAVWVAIGHEVRTMREAAERNARSDLVNLSLAFSEHIRSLAQGLDQGLLGLREHWSDGRHDFEIAVARYERAVQREYTIQIAVIDADGRLAYSNLNPNAEPISLADREHFRVHRDSGEDALFISKPVLGRVSKRWSIQFTRPILSFGGQFDGVLVMSVTPDYFSDFYRRIGLGPESAINLFRHTGEVLARSPPLEKSIGENARTLIPPAFDGNRHALFESASPLDDVRRMYAMRELPELGLVVSVGQATDSIAALSAQQRETFALVGVGATLAILAFAGSVLYSLRQRSKAALRMAHARARDRVLITALEAAPSGIVVTDDKARIQWANPAFAALTGYPLVEALGRRPGELVKSGHQDAGFYEMMWAALNAGRTWHGEVVNRRKDGSTYFEELVIAPVRDDEGHTAHFVGIKQDVSERKATERAVAEESERNQALLRMASDGIYIMDRDGRLVDANNACTEMLGYSRQQLLGMTVFDIDARLGREEIQRMLRETFAGRRDGVVFETAHRAADGRIIDVEVSTSVVLVGDDALLYTSARDITERKRLVVALAETERLWKFALDGSGVGVYDLDVPSGAIAFSDSANALLGLAGDDPVRRIEDWAQRVHPLDEQRRRHALEACLWGETSTYSCEYRYRLPSGHWRWILSRGAVIRRGPDGSAQRFVGTFADIDKEKRKTEQAALRTRVMEALTRGASLDDILELTLGGLERNNFGLIFAVLLRDGDSGMQVAAASGGGHERLAGRRCELPEALMAAAEGEADEAAALPAGQMAALAASLGLFLCCAEPVRSRSGEAEGLLVALSESEDDFVPPDLPEIRQNAALIGIAIHRKQSDEALRLAASVYEASSEAVMVVDPDNRIVAVNPAFTSTTGYRLEEVAGKDPKVLASGRHGPAFYQAMWQSIVATGGWQGEIWNRRKNGEEYVEWVNINSVRDETGAVQRRVAIFSDVSERKAAEELVWRKANYDGLTGLPNRQLFLDRIGQALSQAERDGDSAALLFIDLDHFKDVNDTLGHESGDQLLKEAAARIRCCVRHSDTVARLGGDEFTVLLTSVSEPTSAERVARSIAAQLAAPFRLGKETAYVSASIGITLYPQDGQSVDMLFKQADQAMYAAKAAGRNGYSWFTPTMQRAAEMRHVLAKDLRIALAEDQFELYFQPIVSLSTGRAVKAEALIRWHHPERGQIPPDQFIPIAEDTGLISDIGAWVMRSAIDTARRWHGAHADATVPPIAISINKSPREFMNARHHERWLGQLAESGLPPSALIVEITEGLLLDSRPEVTGKVRALRDLGVRLALDDFGTGYSAMSYLQRYDIDFLKIDRSFVRHLAVSNRDRAIAEAIIAMAHKLGIEVIAEGVEEADQQAVLAAAGCDFVQGFLVSQPVPAAQFEAAFLGPRAEDSTPA